MDDTNGCTQAFHILLGREGSGEIELYCVYRMVVSNAIA